MKKRKVIFYILAPVILSLSAFLLSFAGIFDIAESWAYDLVLGIKPPAQPEKSILLVDTEGVSLMDNCAAMGRSLVLAKELGARVTLLSSLANNPRPQAADTCESMQKDIAVSQNVLVPILMDAGRLVRTPFATAQSSHIMASSSQITIKPGALPVTDSAEMPSESLLVSAKGTGFILRQDTETRIIRGIPLIVQMKGVYVPELGFRAVLGIIGDKDIALDSNFMVLTDKEPAPENARTISLHLTWDGGLPLNISLGKLRNRLRHIGLQELFGYTDNSEKLHAVIADLANLGYLSFYAKTKDTLDAFRNEEAALVALETEAGAGAKRDADFEKYRTLRELTLDETDKLLKSSTENDITSFLIRKTRGNPQSEEALKEAAAEFKETRDLFAALAKERARLKKLLEGSIAIFTDLPDTSADAPHEAQAKNRWDGLVSAGVISTILSEKYMTVFPFWYSSIAALCLSLAAAFIIRKVSFLPAIAAGIGIIVFYILIDGALFVLARFYLHWTAFSAVMILTTTVVSVTDLARRKTNLFFMKASVTGKLSTEAINEIVSKPEHVHAEGEKKIVTVLASEVKAFSLVASKIDPGKLIEIIRQYHSEMGGAILNLEGTIEKHEQDSTLAFFGSPLPVPDHAIKACLASLHMKKLDRSLNKHFSGAKLSSVPISTRIGIATGEVITGNIGNDMLPDFAIVGSAVGLAKQLKSINSLYGTSILITEPTFRQVRADFTVRQLDRVRIGKMPVPLRIYELVEEKDSTSPEIIEMIELYHDALYLFEKREWRKAFLRFQKALSVVPGDKPSKVYLERCRGYMKKPPFPKWDGVFKVSPG